ncbi:MAG: AAA family ATPase [Chloroflexota bacterium]
MARILVIDDDADLLRMLQLALERRGGHEAILCADGADGLAQARETPPDLAIVDVMMPGMTGYEVCRELRQDARTASIPIIVLTARGQAVDREAALEVGADAHVPKPVSMAALLELIEELLEGEPGTGSSRTIALLSLRGGVGVTTVAVNLAATLARRGESVCLVDLCSASGHAALQLGLRPEPNWSDLIGSGVPDAEAVEACLLEHESGLRLLASPVVPLVKEELRAPTVEKLLQALGKRFDLLVVDTPSALSEAVMAALDNAAETGLVVAGEPASIQSTLGTIRALGEGARGLQLIVNQPTADGQLVPKSIEGVLKRRPVGMIPFDSRQARALAAGTPLALSRLNSPLAAAVERLAGKLV